MTAGERDREQWNGKQALIHLPLPLAEQSQKKWYYFVKKKHGEKPVVWDNLTVYVLIAIPFLDCVGLLQNRAQNNTSL